MLALLHNHMLALLHNHMLAHIRRSRFSWRKASPKVRIHDLRYKHCRNRSRNCRFRNRKQALLHRKQALRTHMLALQSHKLVHKLHRSFQCHNTRRSFHSPSRRAYDLKGQTRSSGCT